MRIGIDIESVLTDVRRFMIDEGLKYCKENRKGKLVNIIGFDSTDNVLQLSKLTKVICYDWPYNKEVAGNNIYRCYNWNEILVLNNCN